MSDLRFYTTLHRTLHSGEGAKMACPNSRNYIVCTTLAGYPCHECEAEDTLNFLRYGIPYPDYAAVAADATLDA